MRIGMAQAALGQQRAGCDQFLDDGAVGIAILLAVARKNVLAGEQRNVGIKLAFLIDGARYCRVNFGIRHTSFKILPQLKVFLAVTRSGMDKSCSSISGYMLSP